MGRPKIRTAEELRASKMAWQQRERKPRGYDAAYYARHSKEINARERERYRKNPGMRRAAQHKSNLRKRVEALLRLGGKCVRCDKGDDYRVLQIDHINGGGRRDVQLRGTVAAQRDVLKGNIEGYQLLCANCNVIKKYEMEENA